MKLNQSLPIELTHEGEIISEDGRKWKAGKYEAGVVPVKFVVNHLARNLDPNVKHEYSKPPVLGGEESEPELKLEAKIEDKPVARAATPVVPPAPTPTPPVI
jgi:hypothetical protein